MTLTVVSPYPLTVNVRNACHKNASSALTFSISFHYLSPDPAAAQYANRARNIQNKPVVNRDANSMVISELRDKVQALAAELLRIRSGGGEGTGEDGEGRVSGATLRELAVASTPSRPTQRPLQRVSSARTGSVDMSAPVQRELTLLRARAAEAEGEVLRLTEEAKRARSRESEKDDAVAQLRAELDLAHAAMAERQGGTGADQLMVEIAEAGSGREVTPIRDDAGGQAERPPSLEGGSSGSSPKLGIGGLVKGFFSSSGSTRFKSPGGTVADGSGSREGSQGVSPVSPHAKSSGLNGVQQQQAGAPRERALAVVKDFHKRIQGLEEKLQDSERQRAGLERQLVQHSGGGGGVGGAGGGDCLMVGLSAKLAAAAAGDTGDLSTDAVAEAKKR